MPLSVSLNIAARALITHQLGVATLSHNIANVNTEGYSRQRVRLEAIPGPLSVYGRQGAGGGVDAVGI